jgi:acetyl esterase/lipase
MQRMSMSIVARIAFWVLGACAAALVAFYATWQLNPWPSALFYRYLMDHGGLNSAGALQKHVPANLTSWVNERYGAEPDAVLDVFYPWEFEKTDRMLTTIVWIHGGGFISGGKDQIANYLRVIAGKGYVVVGVNYTIAPAARYPTPVRQVNEALAFLVKNAARYHVDPSRIVLAGDSAGAQLAAQTANIVSAPAYAKSVGIVPAIARAQLAGIILYCGIYDAKQLKAEGGFAGFLRAVGWSYFGSKDFQKLPVAAEFSVVDHVTTDFPPTFISAGNDDPLLPQSLAMADALSEKGVRVDRLFFPRGYQPPLGHEYQFNLDTDAGKLALDDALAFLARLAR